MVLCLSSGICSGVIMNRIIHNLITINVRDFNTKEVVTSINKE